METDSPLIQERKRKLKEIKEQGINPYAHRYPKTHQAVDILEKHKKLEKEGKSSAKVKIAGRLMSLRRMGKASFAHLMDCTGKIQLYFKQDTLGKDKYNFLKKLDIGDIIGAEGTIFRTRMGELTVEVKGYELLTKSLLPLPEKFHGLQDQELRYRQRYLDLIMNPEVKDVFMKRSKIYQAIREFMAKNGFTEVETPILQPNYGGASATPFASTLNALKMKVFMRISDELYLKRLIAGGYEKIFEFSKDFRNEGVDKLHNPEFLQVETMWAYADYKDNMKFCEEYISFIAKKVHGTTKVKFQDKTIDFKTPWEKIRLYDLLKQKLGVDFEKMKTKEEAEKFAKKHGIDTSGCFSKGHVITEIFEELVQDTLIQPT
ncbi:MAG: lysine--tRNA ligase, partial [archaeon]